MRPATWKVSHQVIDVELLLLGDLMSSWWPDAVRGCGCCARRRLEVLVDCGDADRFERASTNLVENRPEVPADPGSPIEFVCHSVHHQDHSRPRGEPGCSAEVGGGCMCVDAAWGADAEKAAVFERLVSGQRFLGVRGRHWSVGGEKLLMERMGGEARVVGCPGPGAVSDFQLLLRGSVQGSLLEQWKAGNTCRLGSDCSTFLRQVTDVASTRLSHEMVGAQPSATFGSRQQGSVRRSYSRGTVR